jgi:hypothetical protein
MVKRGNLNSRYWTSVVPQSDETTRSGERRLACRGHAFCKVLCLALSSLLYMQGLAHAQTAEVSEVKAAYLYNFAKFVEWPADASRGADDPAVICVMGDDRTAEVLRQAVSGKKANGRRVEARLPRYTSELRACWILFIGFSDKERISGILRSLHAADVLTVGQTNQFLSLGGMINLVQKNGTIELEIDPEAADAAGLKVSSRLLVVSRIVSSQPPGGAR